MDRPDEKQGVRLQKYLADCGVASRRHSEEIIAQGRVRVNGTRVTEMGIRIVPGTDKVTLDGSVVGQDFRAKVCYMLHKPRGYIVTASDPQKRKTIYELLSGIPERVVPVGRLDLDSEGLLLLTNDGELAFRLTHPKFGIEKEYEVWAEGALPEKGEERLRRGVMIEGTRTQPAEVSVLARGGKETHALVTITEGKKRQVRVMFAAVGCPVKRLRRIREGVLELGTLPPGKYRKLNQREMEMLRKEVGLSGRKKLQPSNPDSRKSP